MLAQVLNKSDIAVSSFEDRKFCGISTKVETYI